MAAAALWDADKTPVMHRWAQPPWAADPAQTDQINRWLADRYGPLSAAEGDQLGVPDACAARRRQASAGVDSAPIR